MNMSAMASYSTPLTVVSWNIAEAAPSFSASDSIRREREAPRLIRECILGGRDRPDIIALQECPYPSFGTETFAEQGYVSVSGATRSHCGYVDLLLKKQLAERSRPISLRSDLSSVASRIILPNKTVISVSSSHLAPFKTGARQRVIQCQYLVESLRHESDNMIFLGDYNARQSEDSAIENLLGIDAWKAAGSKFRNKFTWDSFANNYHEDGFSFTARFDRCYVGGDKISVNRFGLIGNKPVVGGSTKDFLSDHYGMVIGLDVKESSLQQAESEN
jgi:endonuclease/exonuclease/phosphatase family metal-dependent hydrolase